jgi:peroxiredoxin Q/BCP
MTDQEVLKAGDLAPAFKLKSDTGEQVSLKDFRGKTVILYFYPRDMTPGCTTESCDFQKSHAKILAKGAVVFGVSRDTLESHGKFRKKYGLEFPLLADVDGKVCEAYGVWKEKNLYGKKSMGIVRSTFVIDPKGRIQTVFSKVKVDGHVSEILKLL